MQESLKKFTQPCKLDFQYSEEHNFVQKGKKESWAKLKVNLTTKTQTIRR